MSSCDDEHVNKFVNFNTGYVWCRPIPISKANTFKITEIPSFLVNKVKVLDHIVPLQDTPLEEKKASHPSSSKRRRPPKRLTEISRRERPPKQLTEIPRRGVQVGGMDKQLLVLASNSRSNERAFLLERAIYFSIYVYVYYATPF